MSFDSMVPLVKRIYFKFTFKKIKKIDISDNIFRNKGPAF